jgi:fatty-acyl-CoA synthase
MTEKVYRTELTPLSFLSRSAYMFPDKEAVVYGDRRYSYKEFEERVNRLASRLRDAGFQKGDRIAFLCRTRRRCSREPLLYRQRVWSWLL